MATRPFCEASLAADFGLAQLLVEGGCTQQAARGKKKQHRRVVLAVVITRACPGCHLTSLCQKIV